MASRMRSADRFLAGAMDLEGNSLWSDATVIVADNVARQVHAENDTPWMIEDFHCLIPPWPTCLIEYPNEGTERRVVLVATFEDRDVTGLAGTTHGTIREEAGKMMDQVILGARADAMANGHDDVAWLVHFLPHADIKGCSVAPMAMMVLALDIRGKVIGNRWQMFQGAEHQTPEWLFNVLKPCWQAIALLHCKNVTLDQHTPSAKVQHKRERRGHAPLVRYQTIRLDVPRRQGGGRAHGERINELGAHIVAGHFAHYGDCCPGEHEPNGLLFGRMSGVFWMPMHARGNRDHGMVHTDWNLRPKEKRRSSR